MAHNFISFALDTIKTEIKGSSCVTDSDCSNGQLCQSEMDSRRKRCVIESEYKITCKLISVMFYITLITGGTKTMTSIDLIRLISKKFCPLQIALF